MSAAASPTEPLKLEKIPKSSLIIGNPISQGGFGNVVKGTLNGKPVVVKILHSSIGKKKFSKFQDFCKLEHRNVIKFIGIVDLDPTDCQQLIFSYANKGNLLEWLRNAKGSAEEVQKILNKFACDIINGMEYLHNMNVIHGTLSARNILLDEFFHKPSGNTFLNVKISDYGMYKVTEALGGNYYKMASGKTIPIRWMPKEAITNEQMVGKKMSFPTDVWSFGVILWEMWTKGEVPYGAALSNTEVRQHILNGSSPLTFLRPQKCPSEAMIVMENIFKVNENDRPNFMDLKKKFDSVNQGTQSHHNVQLPSKGKGGNFNQKGSQPQQKKQGSVPQQKKQIADKDPSAESKTPKDPSKPNKNKSPEPKPPGIQQPNNVQFPNAPPDIAPPPYTSLGYPNMGQGMGFGHPPPGVMYPPNIPGAVPYPYPYGMPGQMVPPPPYVDTSSADKIRELEQKISSLEMKGLEAKVKTLEQQQNQQKQKVHYANKNRNPQKQKSDQDFVMINNPSQGKKGPSGLQQNQGQSSSGPDWMSIAGAACVGMAAGVGIAVAANQTNQSPTKKPSKQKKK